MTVSGVKEYIVRVNGVVRATVPASSLSAIITGLNPSTLHQVTVQARDNAGNVSAESAALPVTTLAGAVDGTAPSVPTWTSPGYSSVTATTARVDWNASTDNVGVTVYEVFVGGISKGTTTALFFNLTGLSPNAANSVTVRAGDAAGNWSAASAPLTVTTPAAPSGPTPIARWKFGEGSGATITDAIGGLALTFPDPTPTWQPTGGPAGRKAILIPTGSTGARTSAISGIQPSVRAVCFWGRRDTAAVEFLRAIGYKDGSDSSTVMISLNNNLSGTENRVFARMRMSGADQNITENAALPVGEWHHYVIMNTGTSVVLGIDGVQAGVKSASGGPDAATSFVIGENGGMSLSDIRIYNQALTLTDVQNIMADTAP